MINIWLKKEEISQIENTLSEFQDLKKVILFWSRAKWNYKKWSDIDLVLFFKDNNKENTIWKISDKLNNETILPYIFDIKNYNTIENKELKNHINSVWIELKMK